MTKARPLLIILFAMGWAAWPVSTDGQLRRIAATNPVAAASAIELQGGFRADLITAEPLVTEPIAMQYDENGLAYVVEMNDYPYSDKSHDQAWKEQTSDAIGRVRVLEDTDGDGRFDKSTVFADKLSWPSGVALWKGGVYVAATPDVWYLKDTDGDRRADIRRKVFTGFRKYNVQAEAMEAASAKLHPEPIRNTSWQSTDIFPPPRADLSAEQIQQQISDKTKRVVHRNRPAFTLAWLERSKRKMPITLSALHINDISLLHLPGEPFVEYQLAAQVMFPQRFVAVAGYGDGGPWYIPTAEAYTQGGYEVSVAFCDPHVDRILSLGIQQLLDRKLVD